LPVEIANVPLMVTDHYEYFGLGGRVSKKTTSISLPSGSQSFTTSFEYGLLGDLASIAYPRGDWPFQAAPARQVEFERDLGFLTAVQGYAPSITYQLSGMLHEIDYANGWRWRQTPEVDTGWERPDRIETLNAGGQVSWTTGDYSYDGAGNISAIGERKYVYDAFSRFSYVQRSGQPQREQEATYDAYGNLTALKKNGNTRFLTTSAATNRLTTPEAAYTSNGELAYAVIDGMDFAYGYDGLGQQLFQKTTDKTWVYAYDANDERVLAWECAGNRCGEDTNFERYTLRGLGGEVLRVFSGASRAELAWEEDYVYRDGQPLAWVKPEGEGEAKSFLHADHLGSSRQVTNSAGQQVARHDFLPFGEESTTVSTGDINLKFTSHERDQPGKPMDYMHARFFSPLLGRFLSPDSIGGWQSDPQTWNLFSYVVGNPLKYVDPTGLSMVCVSTHDGEVCTVTESEIPLHELTLLDGRVSIDAKMTREDFARELARDQWSKLGWFLEGSDKLPLCTAEEFGLTTVAGAALVAAGQPWVPKRFVTPGSSPGTSLASSTLSRALPQKLPRKFWAPTTVKPFGGARVVGRVLGRWVPFAGWALLAGDAAGIAQCVGE
jgi:RHS repeat-associated protein